MECTFDLNSYFVEIVFVCIVWRCKQFIKMRFILFKTTFEYNSFKNCLDLEHCIFLYVILQVIGGALLVFTRSKTKMKGLLCLIYLVNKCQIKESLPFCAVFSVNKRFFMWRSQWQKNYNMFAVLTFIAPSHEQQVSFVSPMTNFNDTNVWFGPF